MRALIIEHQRDAPAGRLAHWARTRAITTVTHRPGDAHPWPDPSGFDFVVSLGYAGSVMDPAVPWLQDEFALLRRCVAEDVPVLGLCFGAQALAAATGGTVERAPAPEIGWLRIATTQPELVAPGPWFSWHYDRVVAPPTSQVVAHTALAVHGYTLGRSLGVQFHPEVTPEIIDGWIARHRDALAPLGIDADGLRRETQACAQDAGSEAHALFDRFLAHAALA